MVLIRFLVKLPDFRFMFRYFHHPTYNMFVVTEYENYITPHECRFLKVTHHAPSPHMYKAVTQRVS